jgi:hypothetical protein
MAPYRRTHALHGEQTVGPFKEGVHEARGPSLEGGYILEKAIQVVLRIYLKCTPVSQWHGFKDICQRKSYIEETLNLET